MSADANRVKVKRVYEEPARSDGRRVLVDRIWPRGVAKERAGLDEWAKDAAPSTALRKWYGHDPDRFTEFRRRYRAELADDDHAEAVKHLRDLSARRRLTLLTATRDVEHSGATVLAEFLDR
ncbi:MAG TPA: DUF488 family protein [Acidimicrobiales bacterium]|nr:DUF488 family protein [Acidimicrobiales bacterium]